MPITVAQLVRRIQRRANMESDDATATGLASTNRLLDIINGIVEEMARQARELNEDIWIVRPSDSTVTINDTEITLPAAYLKTTYLAYKVTTEEDWDFERWTQLDHTAQAFRDERGFFDIVIETDGSKILLLSRDGFDEAVTMRHWYVAAPPLLYTAAFNGTGQDDATFGGTCTLTSPDDFEVEITSTGSPDVFKWKKGQAAYTTSVNCATSATTLSNGVTVTFARTTGHTIGDKWTCTRNGGDVTATDDLLYPADVIEPGCLRELHMLDERQTLSDYYSTKYEDKLQAYLQAIDNTRKGGAVLVGGFNL